MALPRPPARSSRFPRRVSPREPLPASSKANRRTPKRNRSGLLTNQACSRPDRSTGSFHTARGEGVERVIFVGDQRQHHAIEAGRPIHQMQEAGMPVARLDTIRRQRDLELREAVALAARGEILESLAILERRGDIRGVADAEQRRKQIAREYAAVHQSGQRVLVVSPANEERRKLNQAIRAELIAHGHVATAGARAHHLSESWSLRCAAGDGLQLRRRRRDSFDSWKQTVRNSERQLCPRQSC